MKIKFSFLAIFCAAILLGSNNFVLGVSSGSENEEESNILIKTPEINKEDFDVEKNNNSSQKRDPYSDEEVNQEPLIQSTQTIEVKSDQDSATESDSEEDKEAIIIEDIQEVIQNNEKLSDEEKKETVEKVEIIENTEVNITNDELTSLSSGLSKETVRKYIKTTVNGGVVIYGGLLLVATLLNPASLACLKLACSQDQAIHTVVTSSLSIALTYSGIKGLPGYMLEKIASWMCRAPETKEKKVE